jgi:hypothetical protein
MMRRLLPHYLCGTMNAATRDGTPPQRINTYSKNALPSNLGEALRRESFVLGRFSWFGCERIGSCPVSPESKNSPICSHYCYFANV